MTFMGHQYAFTIPLNRVWNAAVNRRSGPAVGQFRTRREINRTGRQPPQPHPAKLHRLAAHMTDEEIEAKLAEYEREDKLSRRGH